MEKYSYRDNKPFAQGTYGEVFLIKQKNSGKEMVLKRILATSDSKLLENEIKAGRLLEHPGIAKFQETFVSQDGKYNCLVFDYIPRSVDLYTWMQRRNFYPTSEVHALNVLKQLVDILEYIHSQGVVHRDIKLENVLIDSKAKNVYLLDFGLCGFFDPKSETKEKFTQQFNFSNEYTAPEVYQRKSFDGIKADTYSLGIIFYSLLFGEFPFSERKRLQAMRLNLSHPNPDFKGPIPVSSTTKRLITKMLNQIPEERLSLKEVSSFLQSMEQPHSKSV